MKKKMHPAKKYLMQIEKIDAMIENKKAEKAYWEDMAAGTTSYLTTVRVQNAKGKYELHNMEKVQSSSNQYKMADAVVNALSVQEEIDECIIRLNDKRKEIISVIEQLDANEYDLLHKVYVQYFTLKEVQYMKKKSYSSITSLHGKALNNVMDILERMKE